MAEQQMKSCPLTSIGTGIDMVCSGDKCAWYIANVKKCAMYLMAYDALLSANAKQKAAKK